jgi:hypothetical protein
MLPSTTDLNVIREHMREIGTKAIKIADAYL